MRLIADRRRSRDGRAKITVSQRGDPAPTCSRTPARGCEPRRDAAIASALAYGGRRRRPGPGDHLAGPGADGGGRGEMAGIEYMGADRRRRGAAAADRGDDADAPGRGRAEGRVVFEGEPGEEHYNPIGVVHGGYAATLLDSALGCAVHTTLARRASATRRWRSRRSSCGRSPATPAASAARPRSSTAAAARRPPRRALIDADDRQAARPRDRDLHDHRAEPSEARSRELDQQPHAEAGRAVADVLAADVPGGAGDVEVGPGDVVDELLEERAGVDRAGLALRGRRW